MPIVFFTTFPHLVPSVRGYKEKKTRIRKETKGNKNNKKLKVEKCVGTSHQYLDG